MKNDPETLIISRTQNLKKSDHNRYITKPRNAGRFSSKLSSGRKIKNNSILDLLLCISAEFRLKQNWRIMTILDRLSPDEVDIMAKERTAELGKANQALSRKNRILEGINKIFNIVVQGKTEEELGNECLSVALEVTGSQLGFVNLMGDDGLRHDIAISDMGWEQCLMYDKTGHLRPPGNFVVHGLYGSVINSEKSLFTNDPMSHSDSIGVPHGNPAPA